MKFIIIIAVVFLLFSFMPIIPYDSPSQKGVVNIEHKTILKFATERYEEVANQKLKHHK
jgi:hypothetical protein